MGKLELLISLEIAQVLQHRPSEGHPCAGAGAGAMGDVVSLLNEWSTVPSCGARLSGTFCSGEQTSLALFPSVWGRLPSGREILWHLLRVFDTLKAAQFGGGGEGLRPILFLSRRKGEKDQG